ncbi:replication protein P [Spartinivicinus poritis]|uniref:Replication protein P n=1 Tax=Spartinivicinus poritis TaxID=2994640 RepID=A0ABT5UHY9_9GAMM|nr:replication protein P [Spartinivicinus sp. A2-2]MDE1465968.1 replication protein P [Spartinivicinus sp. A2-2]
MKTAAELIGNFKVEQTKSNHSHAKPTADTKQQWQATLRILYFFERLQTLYGQRYHATFGGAEQEAQAKKEWSPYIQQLNKRMIDHGFEQAKQLMIEGNKQYQWPNIPDMIRLCKPSLSQLGLITFAEAFNEACQHAHDPINHNWSHQAVYLAGKQVGWYSLRCDSHLASVKKQFEYAYHQLCNRLLAGESIEDGVHLALTQNNKSTSAELQTLAKQQQQMVEQGINPKGGRAEFLRNWKQLSSH